MTLRELLNASLILPDDWEALPSATRDLLLRCDNAETLIAQMVQHQLLTEYQASRVRAGKTFGLILGNYRVLERLGSGGMGIIFKAEHKRMRRHVAIKVLPVSRDQSSQYLLRFFAETRAIAQLQHPNIVAAVDAGEVVGADPDSPTLHYLVMEFIPGQDLESYIKAFGPMNPPQACDVIYQIASALAEADRQHLIHRDIKPSNVIYTPEGQAKLLDFGLVHHFRNQLTEPMTAMGTVAYMAPEQARDAASVDIRADIFGLGGVFYWCLTGHTPFQAQANVRVEMLQRQVEGPPSVRARRLDIAPELDAVVARMMATDPDDRYPTPLSVMRALLPFRAHDTQDEFLPGKPQAAGAVTPPTDHLIKESAGSQRTRRVLIVDDEAEIRGFCRMVLEGENFVCDEADNGSDALEAVRNRPYDLVLLDVKMPQMSGETVLSQLRESPPQPRPKVIMLSGHIAADDMAEMMFAGADDFLTKPFSLVLLRARVLSALNIKESQDRSDLLHRHVLAVNSELEQKLNDRDVDLVHVRNALVLSLAKVVEHCAVETESHLKRVQRYARCLAEQAANSPEFSQAIDPTFIQNLECCAPLHDIGKMGLPDHILLKPGSLEPEERIIMQNHTSIGAGIIEEVAKQHGPAVSFLEMAIDLARYHHERYDGQGYPERLAGDKIPLAARILSICDVYDALRCRAVGRPGLSHADTLQVMAETAQGQFDPHLVEIFRACASQFDKIYREIPG